MGKMDTGYNLLGMPLKNVYSGGSVKMGQLFRKVQESRFGRVKRTGVDYVKKIVSNLEIMGKR